MNCIDIYKCNICNYEESRPHKLVIMDFMYKCPKCNGDLKKVDSIFKLYTDKKL